MKRIDEKVQQAIDRLNALDLPAAEAVCREIFALEPKNVNALRIMGAIARERNELERAVEYCQEAVRQADRLAVLHFELGVTLFAMHRSREAYETYLRAIELDPNLYQAYLNVSAIMEQQERFGEARDWALKSLKIKPDYALAHYNLANAQRELGAIDEAIESYELAHRFRPDHPKTEWNLGICHLLLGNYREGWPRFECRQEAEEVMIDRFSEPRWDGSPLAGRTICVHAEQGIGDEILFASCFPDVIGATSGGQAQFAHRASQIEPVPGAAKGGQSPFAPRTAQMGTVPGVAASQMGTVSGRCVLVCDPRLERLFARSFPEAKVYPHVRRTDWSPPVLPERIDVQIPAGSLPLFFRKGREDFPRRKRFLVVEPTLEAMWRERLAALGGELKIGISWRAGGKPTERRKRSIPLKQWGELLRTPGVRFVNLQYGDAIADLAAARSRFGAEIHDWEEGDPLVDVDSYVAKISALDLVISVGNATVHMAGAVGTPAWTLLPTLPSWRWMAAGDVSPWYCGVRLFRQEQRGEWGPVLERIARLLRSVVQCAMPTALRGHVETVSHDAESCPRKAAGMAPGSAAGLAPDAAAGVAPGAMPTALSGHVEAANRVNESCARKAVGMAPDPTPAAEDDRDDQRWLGATELVGHEIVGVVDQLIIDGRLAERSGDMSRAETCYREVLQLAPRHVKALCGLGIVARKTHRSELAIRCFRRALAVSEPVADHHLHLADALLDAGRVDEAVSGYQRALDLNPAHGGAQLQIGRVLRQAGRNEEAASHLRSVLAFDPQNHEALVELGRALAATCRIDEAIDCYRQALRLESDSVAALEALGIAYLEDHCHADAEECFQKAIAAAPGRAEAHFQLARALEAQGRAADARAALEQAVALDPRAEGPLLRLALLRREQGDLDAAAELLHRAVALKPNDANLLNSLGAVAREQGRVAESLRSLDRALQLQPEHAEAHLNRGLALLQAGRLAAGWAEYEWRGRSGGSQHDWQTSLASGTLGAPLTSCAALSPLASGLPRWNGDSLSGRSILIHGEQSPADEVMFASCYEEVIGQAAQCLILCDPRLERLFKRSFPAARLFAVVRGGEAQWRLPAGVRCDVQVPAGSLPLYLRTSASSFPQPHHFLVADAARVSLWRQRYATTGEGLKVGVAWRGSGSGSFFGAPRPDLPLIATPKNVPDPFALRRNLAHWRSLVEWSGALANRVQWINLQDGADAKAERAAMEDEFGLAIHDWPAAHAQYDLDDVAARIAALDLVISAGGVPAHLAGALGVPAWVLVRQEDRWRWLAEADATPWYPSVRLFGSAEAADRSAGSMRAIKPMEHLREELLKRLETPAEEQRMRGVVAPHWNRHAHTLKMTNDECRKND